MYEFPLQRTAIIFAISAAILSCLFCCPAYADRWVYPGAVISVRGATRAYAQVDAGLQNLRLPGLSARKLGPATLLLKATKSGPSVRSREPEEPRRYSRATNFCLRAKTRRLIKKIPGRVRCEPNYAYFSAERPNDPLFPQQWASTMMSLPNAWDTARGSSSLLALVVDSGLLYTHPDIAGNVWTNPGEVPNNGVDDDRNGFVDDIHGINATTGSGDPLDDRGHGTHCAGVLGAKTNNEIGIAGVAWDVKLVAAKFITSTGSGSLANAIIATNYGTALRQRGYNIVVSNNSWGGSSFSVSLYSAIQAAHNAGILFVAAAGNDSKNNDVSPDYPASYTLPNIVSVASVSASGSLSQFSHFGPTSVDIAAPGEKIRSTWLSNSYKDSSGTSMASPQVAGISILAQAVCRGSLPVLKLKEAILNGGERSPSLRGQILTGAIVNADRAIKAAQSLCPNLTPPYVPPTPISTPTSPSVSTPTSPTPPGSEPEPTPPGQGTPTSPQLRPTPHISVGRPPASFPGMILSPTASINQSSNLSIGVAGTARSGRARIQLFARDKGGRLSACLGVYVRLSNGFGWLSTRLGPEIASLSEIEVASTIGLAAFHQTLRVIDEAPSAKRFSLKDSRALCSRLGTRPSRRPYSDRATTLRLARRYATKLKR